MNSQLFLDVHLIEIESPVMRQILLALFVLVCPIILEAQETVTISGQLLDSDTQEPLSFANVAVHQFEDDILLTGAITNEDGRFEILQLPFGKYRLYFSFLGFETTERTLIAGGLNTVFDFGKIALAQSAESLQEVEVVGEQATTNADLNKKSFTLDDNIAQSGGSVLDAMKTMPGVTFDQDGKVILRGSDKVVVLNRWQTKQSYRFWQSKGTF